MADAGKYRAFVTLTLLAGADRVEGPLFGSGERFMGRRSAHC